MAKSDSPFYTPEARPPADGLLGLSDDAKIPNLSGYTMGDLRELLRASAQPDPFSFVQKQQIRPGSYPDQSIGPLKLTDDAWASEPRVIASWHPSDTTNAGYPVPLTGGWTPFGHAWTLFRASALPAVAGFIRQYRFSYSMYYNLPAAGCTGCSWYFGLSTGGTLTFHDPGAPYNIQVSVNLVESWQVRDAANAAAGGCNLEAIGDQHLYLTCLGNYLTALPTSYLYHAMIEGRYVRS